MLLLTPSALNLLYLLHVNSKAVIFKFFNVTHTYLEFSSLHLKRFCVHRVKLLSPFTGQLVVKIFLCDLFKYVLRFMISLLLCNTPHPASFSSLTLFIRLAHCGSINFQEVLTVRCIAKLKSPVEGDYTGYWASISCENQVNIAEVLVVCCVLLLGLAQEHHLTWILTGTGFYCSFLTWLVYVKNCHEEEGCEWFLKLTHGWSYHMSLSSMWFFSSSFQLIPLQCACLEKATTDCLSFHAQ